MIHQEGAREFFEATTRLVRPGEVIHLQNPMAASLVTGVTGRWTSNGILRDVRSTEGRASPEECEFFALVGGGFPGPGGGGPGGGFGASEPPEGYEKVFENSFGSLWQNQASNTIREPAKAAVPLWGLAMLASLGLIVTWLDLRAANSPHKIRLASGVLAFLLGLISVLPLARTAAHELLHPPEAPAGYEAPPFGGPGFGPSFTPRDTEPPEPRSSGSGAAAASQDLNIPDDLKERHDRLQQGLAVLQDQGKEAGSVWSLEDRMAFRRLLDTGKPAEAEALLEEALNRLQGLQPKP